jgi:hypothetical protein
MSYEPEMMHEFSVSRADIEGQMFKYDGGFAECLTLTIEVTSSDLNSDTRKLTGEVVFHGSHDYRSVHDVRPYYGHWVFYTADRFAAEIQLRADQIERLWNIYSTDRQGFLLAINEGPPVPELDRNFEGDFRINFRTNSFASKKVLA